MLHQEAKTLQLEAQKFWERAISGGGVQEEPISEDGGASARERAAEVGGVRDDRNRRGQTGSGDSVHLKHVAVSCDDHVSLAGVPGSVQHVGSGCDCLIFRVFHHTSTTAAVLAGAPRATPSPEHHPHASTPLHSRGAAPWHAAAPKGAVDSRGWQVVCG